MTHLSPAELVDFAEGALDPARLVHLDRCERCRRHGEELRASVHEIASARSDVPEPSPLFWDHLSARIQQGIDTAAPAAASWWAPNIRALIPLAACALMVGIMMIVTMRRDGRPSSHPPVAAAPAAIGVDHATEPWSDASTSEVWEVLTAAAADVEWDNPHETPMAVAPASVDRAVQQLSATELDELGRLLQRELKRSSD